MNVPNQLPIIGWREWVKLPELGLRFVKAKVDTGAASSCLHAVDIEEFERDGQAWVRFATHPIQRNRAKVAYAEAPVIEFRSVRSSSGEASLRPVIQTDVVLLEQRWPIELTLANRDEMGFRMLLGREAIRGRFLVDAGAAYQSERPKRRLPKRS